MKRPLIPAVGLALALGTLSGCGSTALLDASVLSSVLQARGNGQVGERAGFPKGPRGGEMKEGHRDGDRKHGPRGEQRMFAGLDLTADQQAQLKAIAEKHHPAKPAADDAAQPERRGQKLQAILTAATLDVEALKAALAAPPPAKPPHAESPTARLVEMRAVLTADQVAKLVARLEARPKREARPERPADAARPDHAELLAELATKLSLTAEQQAALQAFHAAMEANRPDRDEAARKAKHEAHQAAMLAFWRTGDATQLEALKPERAERPAFPVDALVTLATSLTAEQRQQLFAHGLPGGPGMHGPKGGPGMHGPKSGPRMHGPMGGPRMHGPMGGPRMHGPKGAPDSQAPAAQG
ncbi:MAG: Spy/CpxP family protein refolding chaperone [Candidatus Sericytochromatia bacterium]|nr:Spy/CpxP family protein refolding chaperone [Candidatus Sericytochromatia bacterium]